MMKFFRQYNKQLLAVFMVALMVVFIGGTALESLMTPDRNFTVADSNYGPITFKDQQDANDTTQLLDTLGINWKKPYGTASEAIEIVDWILLLREARKLGTDIGVEAIRGTFGETGMEQASNMVARQLRVKPERIHQALADMRSIQRTVASIGGATIPSEAEVRTATRNGLETVSFKAVLTPAKAFVDEKQTFSDDELKKQFDAYRDKERGAGLSFGYYRAPTYKVQYITIDHAAIASSVGIANLESKAKNYYEQKKALDPIFRRPGAAPPADATGPAPDPYLSFDEAKDKAIEAVRKQQATETATKLSDWILQYTQEGFADVERGEDGYKPAPANVAKLEYYNELIAKIPQHLTFPKAVAVGVSEFFSLDKADRVPELGNAFYRPEGGTMQSFAVMVFRNQALFPKVPVAEGANTSDYMSLHQTAPHAVTDTVSGNAYVFRVVESKPGRPAESVDEVRDEIIADLRTMRGFEAAKKRADAMRAAAATQTLKAVYEADAELIAYKGKSIGNETGFFEPPPMSRVYRYEAAMGRPAGGVATGSGLGKLPNDVVDHIFALEQSADKFASIELKDRAAVLVVQWVETKPATQNEFDTLRKTLTSQVADVNFRAAISRWLDPAEIRARSGFNLRRN